MSRRFIALLLTLFIAVGLLFFYVLGSGIRLPGGPTPGIPAPGANSPTALPSAPATSIDLSVLLAKGGNSLIVRWAHLPDGTTELLIYRSPAGKNQWTLWKTLLVPPGTTADGELSLGIGSDNFSNYDFFVQAAGGGGNGAGGNASTTILWTSPVTQPATTTTSTPPQAPTTTTEPGSPPGSSPSTTASTTTTTTPPQNPPSTNPSSTTPPPPAGTPYYTPQVQISGYGQPPSGNFWTDYNGAKIEFGWQDLPPPTTAIEILRAPNQDGPWSVVLTMQNPIVNGPTTIQIVDDAVNQPFYYEMDAIAGSTTIQTFGPAYLPPLSQ